ncbi:MAG TPA: hypothetical protein VNJ03_16250 [Vicinamibacterales bacterium]|nr:hypothetical protein [Vicinamibacterales bacterium]
MVTRRVAGVTSREVAPFSFKSLYALTRQKGEIPTDPYDTVRWPIVRRGRTAYVRYRFHTRNLDMFAPLKKLTRAVPDVRIALVTHCLDDMDFGAYSFEKGRMQGKWLGGDWRMPFWERVARERKIALDEAYEDNEAESHAESLMTDAAMRIATGHERRYEWSGGRVYRDLWDEREAMMRDLATVIKDLKGD